MDEATAFGLLGQVVSLIVDGRRFDGVMVAGHQVSSSGPGTVDLLLPTRVGEPEKRAHVTVDRVELAPDLTGVPGSQTADIEDSYYEPFAGFPAWEGYSIGSTWVEYLAALDMVRKTAAPDDLQRALDVALRSAALETGAIEGLYSTTRGVTRTVALQGALWEAELDKLGPDVRGHFDAQLAALELVLDAATTRTPMSEAWLRSLHAQVCANQKTFKVLTPRGWQDRPLVPGAYKTDPNNVTLANGKTHWYCPIDQVGPEMHRLQEEMRSAGFAEAHPVIQAAFAHHALTAVHPFADGNGRTARALASVFLYRAVGIPLIVFSDQQEPYWDALAAADAGDPQPFVGFINDRAIDAMALVTNRLRDAKRPLYRDLPPLVRESLSQADFSLAVGLKQGRQQCDFGAPYHTLPDGGAFALRVQSRDPLLPANVETTPFVGIADSANNPFTFIVIDANRPGQVPLKMRLHDMHPSITKAAMELIDGWVHQTAGNLLDDLINAVGGSNQGKGIRMNLPKDRIEIQVLRAIDSLLKDRPAPDRRVDTDMVLKRMGLGEDARDNVALAMRDLREDGAVRGPMALTGDSKVLDVTVTAITQQGSRRLTE